MASGKLWLGSDFAPVLLYRYATGGVRVSENEPFRQYREFSPFGTEVLTARVLPDINCTKESKKGVNRTLPVVRGSRKKVLGDRRKA